MRSRRLLINYCPNQQIITHNNKLASKAINKQSSPAQSREQAINRASRSKMQASQFSPDFKNQLSQKVLNRLEKHYLTTGAVQESELTAYQTSQGALVQARYEKVFAGSIAATFGFIVSRVPLTGASTPEQLAAMGFNQRQRLLMLARLAKVAVYSVLAFGFYHSYHHSNSLSSDKVFDALVVNPQQSKEKSKVFYNRAQIDSMHRAYLLKANKMTKDNESLKKFKFDPQSYH